jgi:hypothetical protein
VGLYCVLLIIVTVAYCMFVRVNNLYVAKYYSTVDLYVTYMLH